MVLFQIEQAKAVKKFRKSSEKKLLKSEKKTKQRANFWRHVKCLNWNN